MRRGRTCGTWAAGALPLITSATASVQRIQDFLSVAWPTVTETCAQPMQSTTWLAALQVVTSRCGRAAGQAGRDGAGGVHRPGPRRPARMGRPAGPGLDLPRRLRRADRRRGRSRSRTAAACCAGAPTSWATSGAPAPSCGQSRPTWSLSWSELGLARLAGIPGLTAVRRGGDPGRGRRSPGAMTAHRRWSSMPGCPRPITPRALSDGEAHISRRGRPSLRLTAWRAVWPMLRSTIPVMAAKYAGDDPGSRRRLPSCCSRRLMRGTGQVTAAAAAARARRAKARVACAASLLRWIYSIVVHDTSWDPAVASGAASSQHAVRCQAEAA